MKLTLRTAGLPALVAALFWGPILLGVAWHKVKRPNGVAVLDAGADR